LVAAVVVGVRRKAAASFRGEADIPEKLNDVLFGTDCAFLRRPSSSGIEGISAVLSRPLDRSIVTLAAQKSDRGYDSARDLRGNR
jgi:hypothetical protein